MSLLEQIQIDMTAAMKAKDELRLNTLRSVKTALDRYRTDQRKPADDAAAQGVLNTLVKQRKEAADAFRAGGRTEMANREEAELLILKSYMPEDASPERIKMAVEDAMTEEIMALTGTATVLTMKNMGSIMKRVAAKLTGYRVEGKVLSDMIKARLS